ncbi:MAG: DUF5615 family PIN-like protein [Haloarculaceae archaeon]
MSGKSILLDEHVGRVFERVLRERGYDVEQAKERFGEDTSDAELVEWCRETAVVLVTNDAIEFVTLHEDRDHAGILLYEEQHRPGTDPEGLARAVDEVFEQFGASELESELVHLDEWYGWVHERA